MDGQQQSADQQAFMTSCGMLGRTYYLRGDYQQAMTLYEQQLALANHLADERSVCDVLSAMGSVFWAQGDLDAAERKLQECVARAAGIGHKVGLAAAVNVLGNIAKARGDTASALQWYVRLSEIARAIGHPRALTMAIGNLSDLYAARGDYVGYFFYNKEALRIDLHIGDRRLACMAIYSMAQILLLLRQLDHAEVLADRAMRLGRQLKLTDHLIYIYETLVEILIERGRLPEAAERHAEATVLMHSFGERLLLGHDGRFDLAVLGIRLRLLQGQLETDEAVGELRTLALQTKAAQRQAKIEYEVWCIDATQETARVDAADLYRQLYAHSPQAEFRRRYAELTGETLPEPTPIEDVLGLVPAQPFDLTTESAQILNLASQVDVWLT